MPEHLPRVGVVHELAEDERRCDHDGQFLAEIGELISEQLDIIPAKIQVTCHIRKKYTCDCGQCIKTGYLVQPLINLMQDRLLSHDIIQMDETTVQVLKEYGKKAQSKSYLWLQHGGPPQQPVVLYHYDPGRGAGVAKRLLAGFTGYLQTDGYDGYNAVVAENQLVQVGCMAHARRRFSEAVKA